MSTTILPSATATLASAANTVTVTAAPVPSLFLDSFWGCLTMFDVLIVLCAIWTALIVGFNRLSMIAIVVPACGAVGNGLLWLQLYDMTINGKILWKPVNYSFMFFGWTVQHFGAAMYAYFILLYLLPNGTRKRQWFIYGYWAFFVGGIIANIILITYTALDFKGDKSPHVLTIEKNAAPAFFLFLAAVECYSAGFLLHTLYLGRKNAKRASGGINQIRRRGLLQQLAQSTEIRLATISVVSIMRSCTSWTWYADRSPKRDILVQIDNFAVMMENIYPVLLIIDLLAARMGSRKNSLASARLQRPQVIEVKDEESPARTIQGGSSSAGPSKPPARKRRKFSVGQTMDSVKRDFKQYVGRNRHASETLLHVSGDSTGDRSHIEPLAGDKIGSLSSGDHPDAKQTSEIAQNIV